MKNNKATNILLAAHKAWVAGADLRARRQRYKQYTYGQQWNDLVIDNDGNTVTEGEFAASCGKKPLTNNLIRQLVKSIVGRFRDNLKSTPTRITPLLKAIHESNHINELDSRALEEFLISGCAIQRIVNEHRLQGEGIWIDNVSPARFFVNKMSDPRGWDIELIGMLHDMSMTEVIMRYSHGSRTRARQLRETYAERNSTEGMLSDILGASINRGLDFFRADGDRCRVIEVWTLESHEQIRCHDTLKGEYFAISPDDEPSLIKENKRRLKASQPPIETRWEIKARWHCRFLAPNGDILDEMDSPYSHGSHPFVAKFYPLTDGEVHSFVEDVIDQQRYVNRLITLIDHIMSTSAKGALLFPDNQRPAAMTWEEIGQRWSSCNGIIPYRPRPGEPAPVQLTTNGTNIGAYELLNLEMKLFEDISGVSKAFQGRNVSAGTSATLYETEARNASIALTDIFETFASFRNMRDKMIVDS